MQRMTLKPAMPFISLKGATLLAFQVCSPAITCEASALPDYGLL